VRGAKGARIARARAHARAGVDNFAGGGVCVSEAVDRGEHRRQDDIRGEIEWEGGGRAWRGSGREEGWAEERGGKKERRGSEGM
jgi:hypothetical protein